MTCRRAHFVFCLWIVWLLFLLALRPPFPSSSGTSRHGSVHQTLVPLPDFVPQSYDALAHEFDLPACSHFQQLFIRPPLSVNSSLLLIRCFALLARTLEILSLPIVHSGSFFGFAD